MWECITFMRRMNDIRDRMQLFETTYHAHVAAGDWNVEIHTTPNTRGFHASFQPTAFWTVVEQSPSAIRRLQVAIHNQTTNIDVRFVYALKIIQKRKADSWTVTHVMDKFTGDIHIRPYRGNTIDLSRALVALEMVRKQCIF